MRRWFPSEVYASPGKLNDMVETSYGYRRWYYGEAEIKRKVAIYPGAVGNERPVKGAQVQIVDKDPGGTDDVIFTSNTNSLGKFYGTSADWQDTKKIRYWQPLPLPGRWITKTAPDPADMMLLEIDIKEAGQHFRGPFVFLGDNVEVPVVVPWGKPDFSLATYEVNGKKCSNGMDLQKRARAAFESGASSVTIAIRGPEAVPFLPIAGKNLAQLKELADDLLPGAKDMLYPNPCEAACILAIAFLILALGAAVSISVVASGIAISLLLGTIMGYCIVSVNLDQDADTGGVGTGVEFTLKKCEA